MVSVVDRLCAGTDRLDLVRFWYVAYVDVRPNVRFAPIVLQNPENAVRLISRQTSKRAPIANRYGLRFVTDLAHEFVAPEAED